MSELIPPKLEQQPNMGVMERMRSKWATLVAAGAALVAVAVSPVFEEQPAYADAPQAIIGMPFAGEWAYDQEVTPPYTDANSSHPSVHAAYGFNWATDLYAGAGTDVKVFGSSPQGTVTFQRSGTSDTCSSYGANVAGRGVTFDVLVNGTEVGEVKYDHLDLTDVGSAPIDSGTMIGEVTSEPLTPSCFQTRHAHVQFKNTAGNNSCYVDHGSTGVALTEGANLGVLGSGNNGASQACTAIPSTGSTAPPPPLADKIDELGFVRTNHWSGNTELLAYHGSPYYTTQRVHSYTGYPAISDPENVRPLAIDTNGDGIDELGFVRFNHSSGQTELALYHGSPYYSTPLAAPSLTGYPAVSDPENVTPIAIDVNDDGVDELGFVRTNHGSGHAELVVYHGSPQYTTLHNATLTPYPSVSDPENVTPLAIDINGDGFDELGFVRTNHWSGQAELVAYHGAPSYNTLLAATQTGYPAVSDPENVIPLAIDVNNDEIDELGFVRMNDGYGHTELITYHGAPSYGTIFAHAWTGYPAVSDPENVTPVAILVENGA